MNDDSAAPSAVRGGFRLAALADLLPAARAIRDHQAARLLLAGVSIGAVSGLAAGAFDRAIVIFSQLLLGTPEPSLDAPSLWRRLLGPLLTGIVAGTVATYFTKRHRPQGVPDVLARVQAQDHALSFRDALVSASAASLAIGGGQSGGREGPIVQLSSALAAKVVRYLGVSPRHARSLIAAGGAAGVAASFNTPVGGAFFALEIILGNFAIDAFAPVVAATVTGTVVGQALLGDRVALHMPPFALHHPIELLFYTLLGALCGAVATAFKRMLLMSGDLSERLALSPPLKGAIAGLIVAAVALAGNPEVMGNGYAYMEALVTHASSHAPLALVVLLVAKMVATSATTTGRSGVGIFAPSLFIGAVAGTASGEILHAIFPAEVPDPGAYGMVGMAAVTAACLHAPITMTLMLFEMTGNYEVILPLLAAVAASGLVSRLLKSSSIYEHELDRMGVTLGRSPDEQFMHELKVGDIMREDDYETLPVDARSGDLVSRFMARRVDVIYLVDADGVYRGSVDIQDAKRYLAHPDELRTMPAGVGGPTAALRPDQALADVLSEFFTSGMEELPVVDGAGHLVGVLAERDVVAAYNRDVLAQNVPMTRVVQESSNGGRRTDFLELPPGQVLEVLPVRSWMANHTLRELGLPSRHEVTVVAIKTHEPGTGVVKRRAALPDVKLAEGDELVVIGPEERVEALERSDQVAPGAA